MTLKLISGFEIIGRDLDDPLGLTIENEELLYHAYLALFSLFTPLERRFASKEEVLIVLQKADDELSLLFVGKPLLDTIPRVRLTIRRSMTRYSTPLTPGLLRNVVQTVMSEAEDLRAVYSDEN